MTTAQRLTDAELAALDDAAGFYGSLLRRASAEIRQLRTALRAIAERDCNCWSDTCWSGHECAACRLAAVARETLGV